MRSRFRKRPAQGGDDDLVDLYFGQQQQAAASPAAERKLKQLCREVYRVLSQALPGDSHDSAFASVSVVDVYPAPDGSRLGVQLHIDPGVDPRMVLERLDRMKGHLRSEIASAIQRKRTPELVFEVAP